MKFYKCEICGNEIMTIHDSGVVPFCCGQKMVELVPNTKENVVLEKHLPVLEEKGNKVLVKVGSVAHPMLPEHYIEWIVILTDQGSRTKKLKPGQLPQAIFALNENEIVLEAYAYCNLHGLWKSE
ncbi:MAG: desulfoferrodoxin family protein [Bacilli bacterium]